MSNTDTPKTLFKWSKWSGVGSVPDLEPRARNVTITEREKPVDLVAVPPVTKYGSPRYDCFIFTSEDPRSEAVHLSYGIQTSEGVVEKEISITTYGAVIPILNCTHVRVWGQWHNEGPEWIRPTQVWAIWYPGGTHAASLLIPFRASVYNSHDRTIMPHDGFWRRGCFFVSELGCEIRSLKHEDFKDTSPQKQQQHVAANPTQAWKTSGFTSLEVKADAVTGPRNTVVLGVMQSRR